MASAPARSRSRWLRRATGSRTPPGWPRTVDRRLAAERVGLVGARRIRMPAVVARPGDPVQGVAVGRPRLAGRAFVHVPGGALSGSGLSPQPALPPLSMREHLARLGDHDVVRVAEARREDLHRPARHQPRLVEPVVAAERVVRVGARVRSGRRAWAGRRSCCRWPAGRSRGSPPTARTRAGTRSCSTARPCSCCRPGRRRACCRRRLEREAVGRVVLLGAREARARGPASPSSSRAW